MSFISVSYQVIKLFSTAYVILFDHFIFLNFFGLYQGEKESLV